MDRRFVVLALLIAAACSKGDASAAKAADSGVTRDTARGSVPAAAAAGSGATPTTEAGAPASGSAPANPQGRIPVLEYHVIGGDKNTLYTRTAASYKADLEEAYKRGYRPISISQMRCRLIMLAIVS